MIEIYLYCISIDSNEFVRRARRYARRTGQAFRLDDRRGKGSHTRLYIGTRFTALQRGKLSKGVLAAMLRQLDVEGKEF